MVVYKVVGVIQADETWQRMKEIYDLCILAGVKVPAEVLRYFRDLPPAESVPIPYRDYRPPVHGEEVLQIDIASVPHKLKTILVSFGYEVIDEKS